MMLMARYRKPITHCMKVLHSKLLWWTVIQPCLFIYCRCIISTRYLSRIGKLTSGWRQSNKRWGWRWPSYWHRPSKTLPISARPISTRRISWNGLTNTMPSLSFWHHRSGLTAILSYVILTRWIFDRFNVSGQQVSTATCISSLA